MELNIVAAQDSQARQSSFCKSDGEIGRNNALEINDKWFYLLCGGKHIQFQALVLSDCTARLKHHPVSSFGIAHIYNWLKKQRSWAPP